MDIIYRRLDEIPNLRTMSITGGEPMFSKKSIKNVVKPLLKYAYDRGIYVQMNSNLTLPQDRYLDIAEYIDVMHISQLRNNTRVYRCWFRSNEEATTFKSKT